MKVAELGICPATVFSSSRPQNAKATHAQLLHAAVVLDTAEFSVPSL
jgi:hypothetical protein